MESPEIISSQTDVHKNLEKTVQRYLVSQYRDSIPNYAQEAFQIADKFVAAYSGAVILDSGCGTGESTFRLAKQFPQHAVIGVDKSQDRLSRSTIYGATPANVKYIHCDLIHFWRLARQKQWAINHHYLFYPNPWPKPGHLQRRWHAHPVFPDMVYLSRHLTMRTNWQIYAQEFAAALEIIFHQSVKIKELLLDSACTPFERKYLQSKHKLYEVNFSQDV